MDKLAVQMNGKLTDNKPCRVIHFKMNVSELKAAARAYHASITVYLLGLMFLAGKAATDHLHGEASIQVPVNMRQYYPSKTLRNFSMYCGIRLPIEETTDLQAIIVKIGEQLEKKTSKESMSAMLMSTVRLVNIMMSIPLFLKQPVAKMVYGFLGDKIFTNTLSNLGVVEMTPAHGGTYRKHGFPHRSADLQSCLLLRRDDKRHGDFHHLESDLGPHI